MRSQFIYAVCCWFVASSCFAETVANRDSTSFRELVVQGFSDHAAQSAAAVTRLRTGGPAALNELFALREDWQEQGVAAHHLTKLDSLIDRVGGQRYCSASRLFWHTDFESAKAAARESGKPILSLRMMGKLTDEYSCANSRFFRTTLYANQQISETLREQFVLHWQSVRPVPKVTIDFGDGRKLQRTVTGNSIHYALDRDGNLIDGLPGLYSPQRFLVWLNEVRQVATNLHDRQAETRPAGRDALLKAFHERKIREIVEAWESDLRAAELSVPQDKLTSLPSKLAGQQLPRADAAAVIARPKAVVEMPLIGVVLSRATNLEQATDAATWDRIAASHRDKSILDASSIELIHRQNPTAGTANDLTATKREVESPLIRVIANLQDSIAVDTVRNEYMLHRTIHQWLTDGRLSANLDAFNERVYAELFLTPSSDPWIGLLPADTYSALENNGVIAVP